MAAAVALLGAGGTASAHEFACWKWVEVPGSDWSTDEPPVVRQFPVKLKVGYLLENLHPTGPSVAKGVEERLMEPYGFRFPFPAPMTLGVGEEREASFELELDSHEACMAMAASDGKADAHFDSALWVKWDLGQTQCAARVTCCTPFVDCQRVCAPENPGCAGPLEVKGPTRHAGFFKLHEQALAQCLAHGRVDLGRVAQVASLEQALGLLWASPGLYRDGRARGDGEALRLELARETLVGVCNARLFGSSGGTLLGAARQALSLPGGEGLGGLVEKLKHHNASGSGQALPPGFDAGRATPAHAARIAEDPTHPEQ
ncbi:MAG TPA: hypothetical protein VLQ93_06910 [Myxococcaceae bacterium]|nr:hypothetical protein [Myxococcaceae bacterium]